MAGRTGKAAQSRSFRRFSSSSSSSGSGSINIKKNQMQSRFDKIAGDKRMNFSKKMRQLRASKDHANEKGYQSLKKSMSKTIGRLSKSEKGSLKKDLHNYEKDFADILLDDKMKLSSKIRQLEAKQRNAKTVAISEGLTKKDKSEIKEAKKLLLKRMKTKIDALKNLDGALEKLETYERKFEKAIQAEPVSRREVNKWLTKAQSLKTPADLPKTEKDEFQTKKDNLIDYMQEQMPETGRVLD